jgi:integrase
VVFFCKKTKTNRKGKAPIYARVSTNGSNCEIHFNCHIEPEKWNQKAERVNARDALSLKLNEVIQTTRTKIIDIWEQLLKEGTEPDCFTIKERFNNLGSGGRMFLAELAKYCVKRQEEVGVRIGQLTANKYHRLLRYLREYTMAKYSENDIGFTRLTYEYIDGFCPFLQTAHRCNNNGAMEVLRVMKIFMRYCERNEWIEKNPFKFYKMRLDKRDITHLTLPEVDTIYNKELPVERLDKIRDIFIFCCYTGLAFTDVDSLLREHLIPDEDGKLWIYKPRQKTSIVSKIPLLPRPLKILRKWEKDNEVKLSGRLLPVPSNQKMNAYLKEIAIICGINKNLTTHLARRTLATNSMEFGMPIDVTAQILGHSSTDMTRRYYVKISDKKIRSEMEKLGERMRECSL